MALTLILILLFPYHVYSTYIYGVWFYAVFFLLIIIIRIFYLAIKGESKVKKNELLTLLISFSFIIVFLLMEIVDSIYSVNSRHELGMIGFVTFFITFLAVKVSNLMTSYESAEGKAHINEVAFINSQIKPHFLYNALSNIISLCYTNPMQAAFLLNKLTTFLRLILENNRQLLFITLKKELDLIDAYVEIEKARLTHGLVVDYFIDENIEYTMIPSLIIQPIVENSIRHGIFHKGEQGTVSVFITKVDQLLTIRVQDDGVGIEKEKLERIMSNQSNSSGIGITNIQRRLKVMKGSTLHIHSQPFIGTTVRIEFIVDN